ncbi:MAG TPA: tryptophan 2,3-dioxygenase family protein [Phycisphaerales bacterium]|nr:tryptophan 2,3-dioxygenase family protein [Phycisphaerales bacterium]
MKDARRSALTYSAYINDQAIVESLRLPPVPEGVADSKWPNQDGWKPGDTWPTGGEWCHDEVLFIRTHQAFEVWFALILHELGSVSAAAQEFWSFHGSKLPRVDLDERHDEDAPPVFDGQSYPEVASVLRVAAHADPNAHDLESVMGNPGRLWDLSNLPQCAFTALSTSSHLPSWAARIRRATLALQATIPFFDVLYSMTPRQFLAFRDRLQPASGFGSVQFRELELVLGLRELHRDKMQPPGGEPVSADGEALPPFTLRPTQATPSALRMQCFHTALGRWGCERVSARWASPSLRDIVYGLLNGVFENSSSHAGNSVFPQVDTQAVDRFMAVTVRGAIKDAYRGLVPPTLDAAGRDRLTETLRNLSRALGHRETIVAALLEMDDRVTPLTVFLRTCLDLDAAILRWRDVHIRFVEAMIGMRRGTGGGGIDYLRTTTAATRGPQYTHGFPCLWQARSFVHRTGEL